jgi:hypothetical protein
MSAEEALSPNEANLAHIASRNVSDVFLADLMQRADILGTGLGVALLVNGMVIMGALAPSTAMAEEVDAEWLGVLDHANQPPDTSDEEWSNLRARVGARQMTASETRRRMLDRLDAEAKAYNHDGEGLDVEAIPQSLARRAIQANAVSHLTIRDARIVAPGQAGVTTVGVLRVAINQIGAWWLLRTDENGVAHTALWETRDESSET